MPGSTFVVSVEPTWASRALQAYFYQVEPSQATADRPAYTARAGYFGTSFKTAFNRRLNDSVSWFVAARVQALHGAANDGSPLLRRHWSPTIGAGIVWTPWRSTGRVGDEE